MDLRIHKKALLLVSVTMLALVASSSQLGYASIIGILPPETLYARSDLVVTGHVSGITSRWGRGGSEPSICTVVSLEVEGIAKGNLTENVIEFIYPGGSVGVMMIWVEDQPKFEIGEHVLMYLVNSEPTSPGGTMSYTITSGTFMGKSDATGTTTKGADGALVPIKPVEVDGLRISVEGILAPFVIIILLAFFLLNWLNIEK